MSAPRKRWVCRVHVGNDLGATVLYFPTGETTTIPVAVSALAMASPPPVITIEWMEETPDA
jgi:hypothetical protein